MSEKRFVCIDVGYGDDWYITDNGKRLSEMEIVGSLNQLTKENEQLKQKVDFYKYFQKDARELEKENEKLRKQIQNYEKLIANSYVGEEERLDGWVGQYVIWEDELQECKNKNEMMW